MQLTIGIIAVVVLVAGLVALWAWRYVKVGPNEVLIVSGRRRTYKTADGQKRTVGYRMVRGGGTFVWPIRERVQRLSLELQTVEVRTPEAYTAQGVKVMVDAVAQVKIMSADEAIVTAAEQFLSTGPDTIRRVALQVVEGHLRAVLGSLSVEDVYLRRAKFAESVKGAARPDLEAMGLDIVSLTVRHVADEQGYLEAVGKPQVANVKREAAVAEAEAERVSSIARLEAEEKVEEKRRALHRAKAEADLAYDLQRYKTEQLVKAEQIALQLKEIERKQHELEAEVKKPADAERARVMALADAEKYKLESEGEGKAAALRATGTAEAEVLKAQGTAEAEAMGQKAVSWKEYNQAAVTDRFIGILPELAAAVSEPLSRTEKIVVVGNGNGHGNGTGVSKITADIAEIIAQLPTVVESLSGVRLEELITHVPALANGKVADESGSETQPS
jgi:flotillin